MSLEAPEVVLGVLVADAVAEALRPAAVGRVVFAGAFLAAGLRAAVFLAATFFAAPEAGRVLAGELFPALLGAVEVEVDSVSFLARVSVAPASTPLPAAGTGRLRPSSPERALPEETRGRRG
ncbi:hypothetical protein KILIM_027_00290, partial [Kineosphaera limosa NBRC 100340]